MDQLEQFLRSASSPGALAEVDLDQVAKHLGDDAARSLDRLARLAKELEEAGLIEQREGRYELTALGIRRIGQRASSDLFSKLAKDRLGAHRNTSWARATSPRARPSPTSSATPSPSTSSAPCTTPYGARARAPPSISPPTTSRSRAPST